MGYSPGRCLTCRPGNLQYKPRCVREQPRRAVCIVERWSQKQASLTDLHVQLQAKRCTPARDRKARAFPANVPRGHLQRAQGNTAPAKEREDTHRQGGGGTTAPTAVPVQDTRHTLVVVGTSTSESLSLLDISSLQVLPWFLVPFDPG